MLKNLYSNYKKSKLNIVKPFGINKSSNHVSFTLCGYSSVVSELKRSFEDVYQVEVVEGDILNLSCDALVSPANSFGEMSGGLDKAIDDFYKGAAQRKAQDIILEHFFGELPMCHAITLDMQTKNFPYLIIAPTMRVPGNVSNTANAYLAMRALLIALSKYNEFARNKIRHIAIPSLCTGVGGMSEAESATQMRAGFDNIVMEGWRSILHPAMAPFFNKV